MARPSFIGRRPRGAPQRKSAQTIRIPPPVLGLNTTDDPTTLDPRHAIWLVRFLPGNSGVRVCSGSQYHIDAATGVRSLLAFHGATSADDRLFSVTTDGIYNITTAGASPGAAVVSFGTTTGNAGYAAGVTMVTNGGPFYLVCDEANGYYYYDPSGATWTKATEGTGAGQISGVDPASFSFVTVWKNRVLFVEKDTGSCWYLPVGQYAGAAARIDFGNKFSSGGSLAGLFSWTHDGGAGVDDFLVAVSTAGDVLVYEGSDPATAGAFQLIGSWSTGGIRASRRFALDVGGDLWLALKDGVLPVSALKAGALSNPRAFVSYPVHAAIRAATYDFMHPIPRDDAIYVAGYMVNVATRAWTYRGVSGSLPPLCMATFQGTTYFANANGVLTITGTLEHVARNGAGGSYVLAVYGSPYVGNDGRWKQWTQHRYLFDKSDTATLQTYARFYSKTDPPPYSSVTLSTATEDITGSWWGIGAMARNVSVQLYARIYASVQFYGADVRYVPGGDL